MDWDILQISEGVWIYLPPGLTAEQADKIIAASLSGFEPEMVAAELEELVRLDQAGDTVPFEEVLAELERMLG
jgi:hypothetical protein